jgi:hypothetical protein
MISGTIQCVTTEASSRLGHLPSQARRDGRATRLVGASVIITIAERSGDAFGTVLDWQRAE